MDSRIHLVFLSLSLAKMLDSSQFMKWFSFVTWSAIIDDLVCLDSESLRVALVKSFVLALSASSWCSFFLKQTVYPFHQHRPINSVTFIITKISENILIGCETSLLSRWISQKNIINIPTKILMNLFIYETICCSRLSLSVWIQHSVLVYR